MKDKFRIHEEDIRKNAEMVKAQQKIKETNEKIREMVHKRHVREMEAAKQAGYDYVDVEILPSLVPKMKMRYTAWNEGNPPVYNRYPAPAARYELL